MRQHIVPVDARRARRGKMVAGENAHDGRLAGAVGTEQPDDLARLHAEGDPLHRLEGAIAFDEALRFDHAGPAI